MNEDDKHLGKATERIKMTPHVSNIMIEKDYIEYWTGRVCRENSMGIGSFSERDRESSKPLRQAARPVHGTGIADN